MHCFGCGQKYREQKEGSNTLKSPILRRGSLPDEIGRLHGLHELHGYMGYMGYINQWVCDFHFPAADFGPRF